MTSLFIFQSAFSISQREYADQVFAKWFQESKIRGTSHQFHIIVDCDSKRLYEISQSLKDDVYHELVYDLLFVVNTKNKEKAYIKSDELSDSVKQCIIDKYYSDVTFLDGAPKQMEDRIRFVVILAKGKKAIIPSTPVFSVH